MNNLGRIILLILIIYPLLLVGLYYSNAVRKAPVREDAVGYYAYLPAVFNNKDLTFKFMIDEGNPYTQGENTFERQYNPEEAEILGFKQLQNGNFLDKYPVGVAFLLMPFYILGHILTMICGLETTGWSFFYQYSAFYGGIVYFLLGILFLKKLLSKYFSSLTTFFTLCAIILGTNLLNYALYENIFSHVYSFFLITALMYFTPIWLMDMSVKKSICLGLTLGLIVLVRQTNAICLFFPLLHGINSLSQVKKRIKLFRGSWYELIIILLVILIVLLPQFLYWKYAAGSFFYYSYGEEGFLFFQPKLFKVLFSTSKGLFFWSPLLIIAFIGLFLLRGKARKYLLPCLLIFVLQVYLVSSWWNWEYGWSYGHRAFTDYLGIFAIGLAAFYSSIKKAWCRAFILTSSAFLVFLSVFQMVQYWIRILPPARTTLDDYGKIFLRLDPELKLFWKKYFIGEEDEMNDKNDQDNRND